MRRTSLVAILAAALALTAGACAAPGPTEPHRPTIRLDDDPPPPDSITGDPNKECGGMIGSGTFVC